MEFATEMIIKSSLYGAKIAEVPITLHPDGRKSHAPHLKTFRDGWRTLRFFLMYSPRWLFFAPGLLLVLLGLTAGTALCFGNLSIGRVTFSVHSLVYAGVAVIIGMQAIIFALFTKVFAISEGLMPPDERLNRLFKVVNLETGLAIGSLLLLIGAGTSIYAFNFWGARSFGPLDPFQTLRIIIPAVTCLALGSQIILGSFFLSILGLRRR
jgi:hypothetical protein